MKRISLLLLVLIGLVAFSLAVPITPAVDAAGTWQQVAVFNNASGSFGTRDVVNDKNRPSNFYSVAQNGSPYFTKSTDYGQTWQQVTPVSGSTALGSVFGLGIAPSVGAGQPKLMLGTGSGFWTSTDGGLNWINHPIAPAPSGRQDVYGPAVDPYDPTHLLMAAHEQALLYQSVDGGNNWTAVNLAGGMATSGTAFPFFVDTGSAATTRTTWLYSSQDNVGTWRTTNSGATWVQVSGCSHNHGASQIYQPGNGVVFMSGNYCTVQRSTDYGVTWAPMWPQNSPGLSNTMTVIFGTPNNVYAEYSGASGCCGSNGPNYATAPQPGTAGLWTHPTTPSGMDGAGSAAVVFDGTNWVIVTANWGTGLWRYVESASGPPPTPTPTPPASPASPTPTAIPPTVTSGAVSASFVNQDTTTQGSWKGKYGADGYALQSDGNSIPAYAIFGTSGATGYTWAGGTSDVRALQKAASSTDRIAAAWYSGQSVTFDVTVNAGQPKRVSIYAVDWDNTNRVETVDVLNATTGAVLDTRSLSGFHDGVYLTWTVNGRVLIRFSRVGGANAVSSGIFFDPVPGPPPTVTPAATATPSATTPPTNTATPTVTAAPTNTPSPPTFVQPLQSGESVQVDCPTSLVVQDISPTSKRVICN